MKKIKVERLVRPLEWVRKTKIDELKVANVSFEKEHGVRNVISKYNTRYGRRTGRFVHVAYNQEAERMGIYVVSQEERKNELNGDKFLLCPVSHRFNILHNHSANKWLCINRKEDLIAETLFLISGDPHGARTHDPNIKSVVLYQLS